MVECALKRLPWTNKGRSPERKAITCVEIDEKWREYLREQTKRLSKVFKVFFVIIKKLKNDVK